MNEIIIFLGKVPWNHHFSPDDHETNTMTIEILWNHHCENGWLMKTSRFQCQSSLKSYWNPNEITIYGHPHIDDMVNIPIIGLIYMGVSSSSWGYPHSWLVYFMDNLLKKWMMTGGTPMTQEAPIWLVSIDVLWFLWNSAWKIPLGRRWVVPWSVVPCASDSRWSWPRPRRSSVPKHGENHGKMDEHLGFLWGFHGDFIGGFMGGVVFWHLTFLNWSSKK